MVQNYTDVDTWTIGEIVDALGRVSNKKTKIEVPQFQRTLVWNMNQRKKLINSVKKGLPIGALLLYKKSESTDYTVYQLIDGLQRATTFKKYFEAPTDFFDSEIIDNWDEQFAELCEVILENYECQNIVDNEDFITYLQNCFFHWIESEVKSFEERGNYSSFNFASYLINSIKSKYGCTPKKDEMEIVSAITQKLRKGIIFVVKQNSDISNFKVPVIIFNGDVGELPTIFERINSSGTQLNKFQIFAATWTAYEPIQIDDTEIIKKIKARYQTLVDEGLEVENFDPDQFYTSKFTYFEYLFGFGKKLSDRYKLLFKPATSDQETDSIGFNIVAICLKHDLKNLKNLPETLQKVNINELGEKIEESIKFLEDILRPYIGIKLNRKHGNTTHVVHAEYQIVSLIGEIFHNKYELKYNHGKITIDDNSAWGNAQSILKETLPFHYLYDILKGFWSATGHGKAMERLRNDSYYKENISKIKWENILNEWYETEKKKKEKVRTSLSNVSLLFLKYLYTHILKAHEEMSVDEFEIDHVVPHARLKPVAQKVDGLPISAISNLALIKQGLNREKKELTIYEYYDKLVREGKLTKAQAERNINELEQYTFTNRKMLDFVDTLSASNFEDFLNFLDERFDVLKQKFYELNNIN